MESLNQMFVILFVILFLSIIIISALITVFKNQKFIVKKLEEQDKILKNLSENKQNDTPMFLDKILGRLDYSIQIAEAEKKELTKNPVNYAMKSGEIIGYNNAKSLLWMVKKLLT